jgi:hypothetical protein
MYLFGGSACRILAPFGRGELRRFCSLLFVRRRNCRKNRRDGAASVRAIRRRKGLRTGLGLAVSVKPAAG